jgi:hypothetical protein
VARSLGAALLVAQQLLVLLLLGAARGVPPPLLLPLLLLLLRRGGGRKVLEHLSLLQQELQALAAALGLQGSEGGTARVLFSR